ncbi:MULTISPECIES: SDR family NAD(P)-dependent oxidoreductase [unclassified Chelatococcus]|uniref:SDR family NAD(P)-dependent oxidoreductase n=1 Tax=unclassified Chelatococcus TaxID=2638111 RepID=UPI001BCAC978|nr:MULTISPECIES: SDR family NAD(P)-dependent oxidoreductase [unclassified Chelatococcus]MBS7699910.1 SDR family NAD(P)-dependent oxidoreductase [Chelatococcus sp. YT9]MBX3558744.1 SDR family NAD(P)-dependent oxidoreductase [Chelatococcus sp.]
MTARVALISGARRGIGAAIGQKLLADGWNLSLGLRGDAVPDWAATAGDGRVHHQAYEATDPAGEAAWVEGAMAAYGRIDAVVASAGISAGKSVLAADDDEIRQMMEINVLAPRRLVKACWPALSACGQGRVIILASLSGKRVKSAVSGSYALSKFAAVALSHAIRQEGFDLGIRATAICPGFVATEMAFSLTAMAPEKMTKPEDIARITALLLDLPNEAVVAELAVNCTLEPSF